MTSNPPKPAHSKAPPDSGAAQHASPPDASATTIQHPTLTHFDWLDTRIEQAAARTDLQAARHLSALPEVATAGPATAFAMGHDGSRVLSQVVLGYAPVIDRTAGVIATRLTVVPLRIGVTPDADALLHTIGEIWPEEGGPVVLSVSSELLLAELLRARPNRNVMVEIPWFVAAEDTNTRALCELAARGNLLLLKGRPARQLPREVLPCFKWSLIDYADDRRLAAPEGDSAHSAPRAIPHIQSGVRTMVQLQHSFERGAVAVIGWPLHDPLAAPVQARPDAQVVLELIEHLDQGRRSRALDDTLMRDPLLAFELLRHVQASAPGQLQVETGSFRQAISLLGEQPLRRWLGGMLARTGDGAQLRPVNFAALRRGLLMRDLAPTTSAADARGEYYMCGVFSLLDRMLGQPVGDALSTLVVPEHVHAALVDGTGPYHALLELVRAIESESAPEIRAAADAAYAEPLEINRALLKTLFFAASLDRARSTARY